MYIYYLKQDKWEKQLSSDVQYRSALENYSKSLVARDMQSLFTRLCGIKSSDLPTSAL